MSDYDEYGFRAEDISINSWSEKKISPWSLESPKGIRVIHLPTGTVVEEDSYKSQHENRHRAMLKLSEIVKEKSGLLGGPKAFSMKDLHGKAGKIMVGVDAEEGEETVVTTFHCDDGNIYVISISCSGVDR